MTTSGNDWLATRSRDADCWPLVVSPQPRQPALYCPPAPETPAVATTTWMAWIVVTAAPEGEIFPGEMAARMGEIFPGPTAAPMGEIFPGEMAARMGEIFPAKMATPAVLRRRIS